MQYSHFFKKCELKVLDQWLLNLGVYGLLLKVHWLIMETLNIGSSFQHLKTVSSILPVRPHAPLLNMYPVCQFHQRSWSFLSMPSAVFFTFAHFGSSIKNDLPIPLSVKELFISQGLSRRLSQLCSWLKPQPQAFLLKELRTLPYVWFHLLHVVHPFLWIRCNWSFFWTFCEILCLFCGT